MMWDMMSDMMSDGITTHYSYIELLSCTHDLLNIDGPSLVENNVRVSEPVNDLCFLQSIWIVIIIEYIFRSH